MESVKKGNALDAKELVVLSEDEKQVLVTIFSGTGGYLKVEDVDPKLVTRLIVSLIQEGLVVLTGEEGKEDGCAITQKGRDIVEGFIH